MHNSSSEVHIPHIMMELGAKLCLKSADKISFDEVMGEDAVVNEFIAKSCWKEQIDDNSSILVDINIGESSTHWWTQFHPTITPISSAAVTTPIPPAAATPIPSINPAITAPSAILTEEWTGLLTFVLPSVSHWRCPSHLKCSAPHELDGDEANTGVSELESVELVIQTRSKRQRVEGTDMPNTTIKLYFNPVGDHLSM